jgi:hypothetical protein
MSTLAAVYLYVILHDENSSGERFRTRMPDMETCLAVLAKSRLEVADGGDSEGLGAVFCGTEQFHRHYGSTWWDDQVRQPK